MKKILLLILTISIFSCSKDDGLSSAEIEAIEFLRENPISIKGIHSPSVEALKKSRNLSYEKLDATWNFEINNNKNFRVISRADDCAYLDEDAISLFMVSNLNINELNFSKINSITKEEFESEVPNSSEVKIIYSLSMELDGLRTTQLPNDPSIIFYDCDYDFSEFDGETQERTLSRIGVSSFNENEIEEYEKHIRVLAGL